MASNMTIEQFDSLCVDGGSHVFSEDYRRRKTALLQSLEQAPENAPQHAAAGETRGQSRKTRNAVGGNHKGIAVAERAKRRIPRVAVAVAATLCLLVPVGAWAFTSYADFFDSAFGTAWRTSQPVKEGTQEVEGKPPVNVVYPASDVVPVDQDAANRLLANAMSDQSVNFTAPDGHELAISNAVRSEYAMVYQFTVHRDGGVTCLEWNENTNNVAAKGAYMPHDQQFSWSVLGDNFLYIDPSASTQDTLVGYGYTVWGAALPSGENPQAVFYTWDVPANTDFSEDQFHEQILEIPCATAVESRTFANAGGGQAKVSPLGLLLDSETGLFTPMADGYSMGADAVFVQAITLNLSDGSSYVVRNGAENVDNTLSLCGFGGSHAQPEPAQAEIDATATGEAGDAAYAETDGSVNDAVGEVDESVPSASLGEDDAPMLNMAFNRLVDPETVVSIDVAVVDDGGASSIDAFLAEWRDGEGPTKTVTYQAV